MIKALFVVDVIVMHGSLGFVLELLGLTYVGMCLTFHVLNVGLGSVVLVISLGDGLRGQRL